MKSCSAMESTSCLKFSLMSLVWIIVLMNEIHGYKACLETERTALLEIKSFFISVSDIGYDDKILPSWVGEEDGMPSDCCDDWERVKCSATTRRVMQLSLNFTKRSYYYDGTSASLLNMSLFHPFEELQRLDLPLNRFTGIYENRAYDSFGSLKQLKILNLGFNDFNDSILPYLNTLTSLTTLNLGYNKIEGSRTKQGLANLRYLQVLDLNGNRNITSGSLTRLGLANLTNLKELDLDSCGITTIQGLAKLKSLEALYLSGNNINGSLARLANLTNLQVLDLNGNQNLTTLGFAYLPNLKALDLGYCGITTIQGFQLTGAQHGLLRLDISSNRFTGKLPQNMSIVLPKLVYMNISKNSFEGNIPSSIGKMQGLRFLDVSSNNFAGELSQSLVINCFSLEWLDLSNNNFDGQIFRNYMNLTQLWVLYLHNNNFSGKIKDGLLRSTELKVLDISNNILSGHIPSWMGNFSHLQILSMSQNLLEGNIPVQFNNLARLQILNISENNLSGSMISALNLSSVEHLYLEKNALGGSIPNTFFRGSTLETLDLRDNHFSGRIPRQINEHSNLRALLLRGNYLQGPIPDQLCRLRKLGIMDLSHNRLNGSIPACITNMLFWKVGNGDLYGLGKESMDFDIADMRNYYNSSVQLRLDGSNYITLLFFELGKQVEVNFMTKNRYESYKGVVLELMAGLDLSNNELTGDIPSEIGDLQNIHGLNLSHNFLSGSIPESFSNLKMIESLDLSHNKLNGQIPHQLTELHSLSTFDVSYNNLSGPIPDKDQFPTFDESSYRGNLHLCGRAINKSCTNLSELREPSSKGAEDEFAVDMVAFYWSFVASCVTVMLGLLAILWVNPYWRRLWFYFIEECIDLCYYWLFKYVIYW